VVVVEGVLDFCFVFLYFLFGFPFLFLLLVLLVLFFCFPRVLLRSALFFSLFTGAGRQSFKFRTSLLLFFGDRDVVSLVRPFPYGFLRLLLPRGARTIVGLCVTVRFLERVHGCGVRKVLDGFPRRFVVSGPFY